jgi:hypothetical protein
MPEVPTLQEIGFDVVLTVWAGAFVPAGTPFDVVARLNAEMEKALADPTSRGSFDKAVLEPLGSLAKHTWRNRRGLTWRTSRGRGQKNGDPPNTLGRLRA